ncbi:MAG: hypothetical protein HY738_06385 [Bacteroidia bacterium]|nr:hypothetical protein [Bacteroidia bacterium]
MKIKHFYILFFLLIILSLCKKEHINDTPAIDYTYFPLDTNSWLIYDVEEIQIDNYDTLSHRHYKLKESFVSTFIDNEGRITYRIERYTKENDTLPWTIKDVWAANLLPGAAHKVEENIRYIKLVFPVALHKSWNGNAYNHLDEQIYEITALNEPESIDSLDFDSVLTVTQQDDENLIEKKYFIEKFAKHFGLIYKEIIKVEADSQGDPDIMKRMKKGYIYRQKIIF